MAGVGKLRSFFIKAGLFAFCSILSILGAWLGFHLGEGFFKLLADGRFVQWKRLPDPPSKVLAISKAAPDHIYVRTVQGVFFIRVLPACLEYDPPRCWEKLLEGQAVQPTYFGCGTDDASSQFQVPAPPVKYVQYVMTKECGGEWYNETHYIRAENGEIWAWRWGHFSMGMIGPLLLILLAGVVLGFILGLAIARGTIKLVRHVISRGGPRPAQ